MVSNSGRVVPAAWSCTWPRLIRHFDPQQHFTVYRWRSPQGVLFAHSSNEIADLVVYTGTATAPARFPTPVGPKAAPMPPNNGFGLDHDDRIQNRARESGQPHEGQPIDVLEPHPRRGLAAQDDHMLPQNPGFRPRVSPVT